MEERRQADVDGVDLRIRDRRLEIGGDLRADDLGHALRALGRPREDRLDAHPLAERLVVVRVRGAHEPAAEDRQRDRHLNAPS